METPELVELPRISVIIPVRNQVENLRRSVAALDRSKLEVIVVDNNSSDDIGSIEEQVPGITLLRLPKNFGWVKAANIGLRTSQAELVLILSPRTELDPGAPALLADAVESDDAASAATPLLRNPDGTPAAYLRKLPTPSNLSPEFFAPTVDETAVEFPGAFALLVRKSFLKGMSFFDERYGEQWGDAEVAAQIRRASRKILLVSAAGGVLHPAPPSDIKPALLAADFEAGAATYLGKHFGGGLGRRAGALFSALGGMKLAELSHLISGQKIDGTQE